MKKFTVQIPICGHIETTVEAEDEASAEEAAWEKYNETSDFDDGTFYVTWEAHDRIVEGNIFHGELEAIEVMEVE